MNHVWPSDKPCDEHSHRWPQKTLTWKPLPCQCGTYVWSPTHKPKAAA